LTITSAQHIRISQKFTDYNHRQKPWEKP
jgi:hypothetical protein